MHRTIWNPADEGVAGYWGVATASLDWCEANYEWTRYIAEVFNTFSNVAFVALAVFGIRMDLQQRLPKRFALAHGGLILIGVGSALFHSTLLYSWQLWDELPMIAVSTLFTWVVFDITPLTSTTAANAILPSSLILFNIAFIWAYLNYPNPVFHQVAYGLLVTATSFRAIYLLYFRPIAPGLKSRENYEEARRLNIWGSFYFIFAFAIWNVDNVFCQQLTQLKKHVGSPAKFLLEFHSWWHIFVGLGVYFIIAAVSLLTLSIRDSADNYEVNYLYGFLPWVGRTPQGWQAIQLPSTKNERTKLVN